MSRRTAENFEITWRKELLKRLRAPMNTLTRQVAKEQERTLKRIAELKQYSSPEEAHEAYGYGYITLDEYDEIRRDFETAEKTVTPVAAAMGELQSIISGLSDEEKAEIEKRNDEWRKSRFAQIHNC
jgi:hypothetical protein